MDKFNLLTLFKQSIMTAPHSEQSYARNSFGMFAYGKGFNWILRSLTLPQNDDWAKRHDYIITGLPRKVNLARNDGQWESAITKKIAFTMAEILLSLTIIGVVAAITLPSLTGNINERTWNTQRKALYARMSQAIALMGSLNGYGIGSTESETASNAAKVFIYDGLAKVYKINNICDNQHFEDCGIGSYFKNTRGSQVTFPKTNSDLYYKLAGNRSISHSTLGSDSFSLINTRAAAFETANGESIAVFYQPFCKNMSRDLSNGNHYVLIEPYMCANFVFDLNGKKGPNTAGKDIGYITALYPIDSTIVMPQELPTDSATNQNHDDSQRVCTQVSPDVRIPSKEELAAMLINYKFNSMNLTNLGATAGALYAAKKESLRWTMDMYPGAWSTGGYNGGLRVRCITR